MCNTVTKNFIIYILCMHEVSNNKSVEVARECSKILLHLVLLSTFPPGVTFGGSSGEIGEKEREHAETKKPKNERKSYIHGRASNCRK